VVFTAIASGFSFVDPKDEALIPISTEVPMLYVIYLAVLVYLGVAHDVSVYLLLGAGFMGGLAYVASAYAHKPAGYNKDIRKWG
jgi:hypothetical protein